MCNFSNRSQWHVDVAGEITDSIQLDQRIPFWLISMSTNLINGRKTENFISDKKKATLMEKMGKQKITPFATKFSTSNWIIQRN